MASWRRNNYRERFGASREQCLPGVWSSKAFAERYVVKEQQKSLLVTHTKGTHSGGRLLPLPGFGWEVSAGIVGWLVSGVSKVLCGHSTTLHGRR